MSKLVVFRGNSGSGKSTVANLLANKATRKLAVVDADYYRVTMLHPKPFNGEDLGALMRQDVLYCLEHGYNVIWDSIFYAHEQNRKYLGEFFDRLHPEDNFIFNFVASFEETVKRHNQRPKSGEFTADQMKEWYKPVGELGYNFEYETPETNLIQDTVKFIEQTADL